MKTDTKTLIKALRILAEDIQTDDGVANACIAEAADRLEDFEKALSKYADEDNWINHEWVGCEPYAYDLAKKTLGIKK